MNDSYWGYHLILDCHAGDISKVTDPEHIKKFSQDLVKRIDMIAYGEPQIVHFADHCPDKAGWTLIQLIETSNICGHFLDDSGDLYLDVFSCKEFEDTTVIECLQEYFSFVNIATVKLVRSAIAHVATK